MKIKSVEIFTANLELKDPLTFTFFGKVVYLNQAKDIVVKIVSDNDYVGYGSTSPVTPYHGMTQETIGEVCKYLAPFILEEDPFNIARIHDLMDWAIPRGEAAKCAIDLAIYDLIGKYTNKPAYALLGGKRREEFYTTWTLPSGRDHIWSDEETAKEAKEKYDLGYRGFEVHIGTSPGQGFEKDVSRIAAIKGVCPDVSIDADAHRNWTVKEAVLAIRELEKYHVWVEQPCATLDQMAEVRPKVNAGIIADEGCHNIKDTVDIIKLKAADAICLKPIKAGGLFRSMQMATLCENFGLAVRVDGIPGETKLSNTASAHVTLTLKEPVVCGVMQHSRLGEEIVTGGGIIFKDGKVSLPDKPGLGCDISEEHMKSIAYFNKS